MKAPQASFLRGVAAWEQLPADGRPEVALLGRSNVGKSSLLNMLLGQRALARVSKTPGRTRELNFFGVDERAYVVDLPGLGYANAPKTLRLLWTKLIDRYLREREELVLVLHLVDIRHEPMPVDLAIMDHAARAGLPYAAVLTKADKVKRQRLAVARRELDQVLAGHGLAGAQVVVTSSEKREGRSALWQLIEERLAGWRGAPVEGGTPTDGEDG